tara:strand:+ start:5501 stop:5989 length:489 start_codon:yes stop_codon:yes gene_type:complete
MNKQQHELCVKWMMDLEETPAQQIKGELFKAPDKDPDIYQYSARTIERLSGYCCLGRLCEVAGVSKDLKTDRFINPVDTSGPMTQVVPKDWFMDKTGLPRGFQEVFINMNDERNFTFKEIADHIRSILYYDRAMEGDYSRSVPSAENGQIAIFENACEQETY